MHYKGVEYSVIQLLDSVGWRWVIRFGDGKHKIGVTPISRAAAIKLAESEVDRALKDVTQAPSELRVRYRADTAANLRMQSRRRNTLRWGLRLTEQRAYTIGLDGRFTKFEALVCADDAEAIDQARRLVDGRDVELWSGDRFITRLGHKPEQSRLPAQRRSLIFRPMEIEASIASFASEPNGALPVLPSPVAILYRSPIGETAEIPFWPGRGRRFRAKADIESQAGSASSVALSLACDRYFVGVVVLDR